MDLASQSLVEHLLDSHIKQLQDSARLAQAQLGPQHPSVHTLRLRLEHAEFTRLSIDPIAGFDRRNGRQAA